VKAHKQASHVKKFHKKAKATAKGKGKGKGKGK
jgi:hypothetical protein